MSKVQSFFERRKKNTIKASFHIAAAAEAAADGSVHGDELPEDEKSEHEANENTEWKVDDQTKIETAPVASSIALKLATNNENTEIVTDKNKSKLAWSKPVAETVQSPPPEPEKKVWVPSFKNRIGSRVDSNPNLQEASAILANKKKEPVKKKTTKNSVILDFPNDLGIGSQIVKIKFDVFELLGERAPIAEFSNVKARHQLVSEKYKGRLLKDAQTV